MDFVQYKTGKDDEDRRLDRILRILFPDTPLSSFYSAIRKGLIRVNDKRIRQDYHIHSGDTICVASFLDFIDRSSNSINASNKREIGNISEIDNSSSKSLTVFNNEHILILNKPFDVPVHETSTYKGMTLNQYVLSNFTANNDSLSFTPGPLHRLDRKTTGLIVFSQSIKGAHEFTDLLKKHEVKKTYLAVVNGILNRKLVFSDYIEKDSDENGNNSSGFHKVNVISDNKKYGQEEKILKSTSSSRNNAKKAVSIVNPIKTGRFNGNDITFVEVQIETGRTHQIRSQCAAHGFPLSGDSAYGGSGKEGLFLHAWKLELLKPNALGLPDTITAPIPERFSNFLEKYLPTLNISLYNK